LPAEGKAIKKCTSGRQERSGAASPWTAGLALQAQTRCGYQYKLALDALTGIVYHDDAQKPRGAIPTATLQAPLGGTMKDYEQRRSA